MTYGATEQVEKARQASLADFLSKTDKHGGRNTINCLTDIIGMDFKTAVEAIAGENISHGVYNPTEQAPTKSPNNSLIKLNIIN